MIGKTISHYKILEKLGEGGMGVVYKAEDARLMRLVALKFLPTELTRDPEAKKRFVQEAQAASALDDASICTIHEIDQTEDGQLFIVMAYYDGETLRDKLESASLTIEDAKEITAQVAKGLSKAHAKGIIHRDIKPANLLITEDNEVKIIDFGLARLSGKSRLTKTHTTMGTTAYLSPEQARGEDVDHRTDIWSLGVVLYEMITGELPFKGDYEQAVMYSILLEEPEPLNTFRPDLPTYVEQIIDKALEKELTSRYQNIQELSQDLKEQSSSVTISTEQEKSIVVLPFEDISPGKDNEYFSDGLTEEIMTDLAKILTLRVISRTSAMMLKGTRKAIKTIGRDLNVRYILEGSVRKAGNKLRITVQLIDARTDAQLWGEKYRGTLDDVFEIQEQVSRAIVNALQVRLSSHEEAAIAERPIPNLLAYDYYLRARHDIYASNRQALERALANLERGLELTGKNSVILRGMGLVKFQLVNMGIDTSEKLTEELLEIALDLDEIDPTSANGPLFKGLCYELRGDAKSCMRHLRIAHARDPNDQDAMFWLCIGSSTTCQVALARCLADKLVSIDPLIPLTHFFVGYTAFFDGKAGEGLDAVQRALEIGAKEVPAGLWGSVRIMAAAGCMKEARQLGMILDERHPDAPFSSMARGFILALDGATSEARSAITPEVEAWAGSMGEWAQFMGDYYAVLGDKDRALEWLERSVSLGFLNAPFLARGDPFLRGLRGDPRFQNLVARTEQELSEFEKTLLPVKCSA